MVWKAKNDECQNGTFSKNDAIIISQDDFGNVDNSTAMKEYDCRVIYNSQHICFITA